ncbi:hypothetical protein Rhein_0435 [Rheinheimera sp. A13L]|uniref:CS1 type fimbrial major subunit n=1 Tax=Rheinheimera sp. A13L TaxID=506534 RepID=UPI0002124819|nr:CS1 type fimbrial major subunit [Rheinheimera sp. A13L]EGM79300.1 hypothetical protein Rhein_0435 [Rheinheimera sp. A13L]
MIKIHSIIAFLLLSTSHILSASDILEHKVKVIVELPNPNFIVRPPTGNNWLYETQTMRWDMVSNRPSAIRQQLYIESSLGPVTARLYNEAELVGINDSIPLNVYINSVLLTTTAQQILNSQDSHAGRLVPVHISVRPAPSGTQYQPGTYLGQVNIVFDILSP